jgi:tryptophan synthase alpha chain
VGFGISSPEQVRAVGEVSDGVVVGSALVNCISENLGEPEVMIEKIGARAKVCPRAFINVKSHLYIFAW